MLLVPLSDTSVRLHQVIVRCPRLVRVSPFGRILHCRGTATVLMYPSTSKTCVTLHIVTRSTCLDMCRATIMENSHAVDREVDQDDERTST